MNITDERVREALAMAAAKTGVREEDILGKCRTNSVVFARHMFFVRLWRKYNMSFVEIGAATGRDHTTVMYAVQNALGPTAYALEASTRRHRGRSSKKARVAA